MFYVLLLVTLITATIVSFIAVKVFSQPITNILNRIVDDTIAQAWAKYLTFAIYVVGISGGVRIYQLERYITAAEDQTKPLALTPERWVLEIYRTIIEALQSIAWMLLIFFVFALIAYVLVKIFDLRRTDPGNESRLDSEPRLKDVAA